MCKCKAKWWALGAVAAVVAVVVAARGCVDRGGDTPEGGGGSPSQQADDNKGAAERAQAKIEERMADTNYVAGLEALAKRNGALNALRAAALRELAAAEAEGDGEEQVDNGKAAAAREKLAKIDEAIEENRRMAAEMVSARVRRQSEKEAGAKRKAGGESNAPAPQAPEESSPPIGPGWQTEKAGG